MTNSKTLILAEAGVNHNGSIELAKQLIREAKNVGADAIKFQTFHADNLVSRKAEKAEYQKLGNPTESQYEMIKKLELSNEAHIELIRCCSENNIQFISSPFDLDSVDFLNELGLQVFKIPSGEITNFPYLVKIGKLKKTIFLSTGMSDIIEVRDALNLLISNGTPKSQIVILQCNTEYPTPFEDVNLNAMLTIQKSFDVRIGYSDHTDGIEASVAAVALGAEVIEKHFTLDKGMIGPDHKASLEPDTFLQMVSAIRNVEKALGNGIKIPSKSEIKNISIARKSIIAIKPIRNGEIFTEENIGIKRPGNGISPMRWIEILGMKANKNYQTDELIEL